MLLTRNVLNAVVKFSLRWVLPGWISLATLALTITACQTLAMTSTEATPSAVVVMTPPTAEPTPTVEVTSTVTATTTPEAATLTLTFWTVEAISPRAEGESGRFITRSLQAFKRANPNVEVDLLLKKAAGKGGTLDFLRTAKNVAPSVLPDVAILNATDLAQAYSENLIQPLDGRLGRSIVQDLLPAARRIGTVDGKLVGVPVGLEMEHIVYNSRVFTSTPLLWSDVISSESGYLFPAKGVNGLVNDATLSQYFSAGGKLLDDQAQPTIDDRVLLSVLDFYEQSLNAGVVDASLLEAAMTEELWPAYLAAEAGIAQVSVRQYLEDRETLENTVFAPLPVQNERDTPVAIIRGWALVLVTEDKSRQAAALNLIEWFLSTSNNVTWNNINRSIPTRDTAYQQLAGNDPYWSFLTEQLNAAQPQPSFAGYDRLGRILQQAVEQVINQEATAEKATATAIDALAQ